MHKPGNEWLTNPPRHARERQGGGQGECFPILPNITSNNGKYLNAPEARQTARAHRLVAQRLQVAVRKTTGRGTPADARAHRLVAQRLQVVVVGDVLAPGGLRRRAVRLQRRAPLGVPRQGAPFARIISPPPSILTDRSGRVALNVRRFQALLKIRQCPELNCNYLKKTPENAWFLHALLWKGRCTQASPCSSMRHAAHLRKVCNCVLGSGQARTVAAAVAAHAAPPGQQGLAPGQPRQHRRAAARLGRAVIHCRLPRPGFQSEQFVLVLSSRDTCKAQRSDSEQQLKRLLRQALCNQRRTERWKGRCTSMGIRVTKW